MPTTKPVSKPRQFRDDAEIDSDIMRATKTLIEDRGFSQLTLTAVMRKARVQPHVFYRRYKNLDALIGAFTLRNDYWPKAFGNMEPENNDMLKTFNTLLVDLSRSLYDNVTMQRMLTWGLETKHSSAMAASELREALARPFLKKFFKTYENTEVDAPTIAALFTGGIYYLILSKEISTFCDVDFNTKEGKQRLSAAVEYVIKNILGKPPQPKELSEK